MTEEILSRIKLKLRGFNLVLTGVYKLKVTPEICHTCPSLDASVVPECDWELVGAYPYLGETRFVFFSVYNGAPVYCLFSDTSLDFIIAKVR